MRGRCMQGGVCPPDGLQRRHRSSHRYPHLFLLLPLRRIFLRFSQAPALSNPSGQSFRPQCAQWTPPTRHPCCVQEHGRSHVAYCMATKQFEHRVCATRTRGQCVRALSAAYGASVRVVCRVRRLVVGTGTCVQNTAQEQRSKLEHLEIGTDEHVAADRAHGRAAACTSGSMRERHGTHPPSTDRAWATLGPPVAHAWPTCGPRLAHFPVW